MAALFQANTVYFLVAPHEREAKISPQLHVLGLQTSQWSDSGRIIRPSQTKLALGSKWQIYPHNIYIYKKNTFP